MSNAAFVMSAKTEDDKQESNESLLTKSDCLENPTRQNKMTLNPSTSLEGVSSPEVETNINGDFANERVSINRGLSRKTFPDTTAEHLEIQPMQQFTRSLSPDGHVKPCFYDPHPFMVESEKTQTLDYDKLSSTNDEKHMKPSPHQTESGTGNGIKRNINILCNSVIDKVFQNSPAILVQEFCSSEENTKHQTTVSTYSDKHSETQHENHTKNKKLRKFDKVKDFEKERLVQKITSLEYEVKQSLNYKKEVSALEKEVDNLKTNIYELKEMGMQKDEELRETMLQLGSLCVEYDMLVKENKTNEQALQNLELQLKQTSVQSLQPPSEALSTSDSSSSESESTLGAEAPEKSDERLQADPEAVGNNLVDEITESLVKVSTEESSDGEGISLGNVPTTTVEKSLYNNYKLLLLTMAPMLLTSDVVKLKNWARGTFSIDTSRNVIGIFWELDREGVISVSDLKSLRDFFEKILRIDLTHLIDYFKIGDYSFMRKTSSSAFSRNGTRTSNGRSVSRSLTECAAIGTSNPQTLPSRTLDGKNQSLASRNSEFVENEESFVDNRPTLETTTLNSRYPAASSIQNVFQRKLCGEVVADRASPGSDDKEASTRQVDLQTQEPPATNHKKAENSIPNVPPATNYNRKSPHDFGSNSNKLSKFQRSDSQKNNGANPQDSDDDSGEDDNEQYQCSHYKRRCHVKFACCDKFWPCHRCHNNESNCGQKKLKSIHTKFVKCVKCKTEQEFSANSQFCINCHSKLAKYFCPICKHLTGKDDKPYHCEKCGICRIHKHRSFHCDICGVCLDVQLQDNHKCRAGSAHDECCICLEDAFSGCQILPCSHKVHKECASQMIRNGITRCPICRESFAHKLEKRPARPPQKHHGKK